MTYYIEKVKLFKTTVVVISSLVRDVTQVKCVQSCICKESVTSAYNFQVTLFKRSQSHTHCDDQVSMGLTGSLKIGTISFKRCWRCLILLVFAGLAAITIIGLYSTQHHRRHFGELLLCSSLRIGIQLWQ